MVITPELLGYYCSQWSILFTNSDKMPKGDPTEMAPSEKEVDSFLEANFHQICRVPKAQDSLKKLEGRIKSGALTKILDRLNGKEGPIKALPRDILRVIFQLAGVQTLKAIFKINKVWNGIVANMLTQDGWLNEMSHSIVEERVRFAFVSKYLNNHSKLVIHKDWVNLRGDDVPAQLNVYKKLFRQFGKKNCSSASPRKLLVGQQQNVEQHRLNLS